MPLHDPLFTHFKAATMQYSLPTLFTFPFYYQPHPLCLLAANELQDYLKTQQEWTHNFGLAGDTENAIGKMFGVLLVENKAKEIGYLSAFSGKLAEKNHLPHFVPPVFDRLQKDSFFMQEQRLINALNQQIQQLEENPQILICKQQLSSEIEVAEQQIKAYRNGIIENRKKRKSQRHTAQLELNTAINIQWRISDKDKIWLYPASNIRSIKQYLIPINQFIQFKEQLAQESIQEKLKLRDLQTYWKARIQTAEDTLNRLTNEIGILKNHRKEKSNALQKNIFDQYRFLNRQGVSKSLATIFQETPQQIPPAGAGECAAPKLLHYAFGHGLKPLAMAEFWWGTPPKSEIRRHRQFYPACQGKCQPILGHMLAGVHMDKNPLLDNPAVGKSITLVYQDEAILVINKPAEFLSVPGKNITDSVYLRIKQSYPQATGPLIVHRLDMSTSGLMVIALSKTVHKALQKQFIKRTVKKRYIALLEGNIKEDAGLIELPLRVDLDDRPRQLVCYDYGKPAKTQWQVIERKQGQTKIHFYPVTGRTHQLRVHAAHRQGLNSPIVGDDLYGNKASRLYLHAEFLEIQHPITRTLMQFQVDAEF